MSKQDFFVNVQIKERVGSYWSKIDSFSGSPERIINILENKYASKRLNFFEKMHEALDIAGKEIDKQIKREKK